MTDRRNFLRKMAGASAAGLFPFFHTANSQDLIDRIAEKKDVSSEFITQDEDFWNLIHQAYTVSPNIINLNNGGVSPQPRIVQEAVEHYNKLSNEAPSYYMWRLLDRGREPMRKKLAKVAGCSPDEIAINRNTSEAIETVIFGLRLKPGDEVVLTRQDYPNMINAWKQRQMRDGVALKWLNFEFPLEDKQTIVDTFVEAFTPRTRIVHLTHMINWMGQILPVREIADEAQKRGIEVLVDAAHTFAHLDYKIEDLNCDYLGTSLHKWMCAPFGSGMLYVKKEKIRDLYPLFAGDSPESDDIRKFENLGTRSFAIEQAIGQAVNFHEMIGAERKEKRLHFLKNYWAEKANEIPGMHVNTSLQPDFACAIALLQVDGKTPRQVSDYLFNKHRIHTVAISWENIEGVRITPNVYTRTADLDFLMDALQAFNKS